MNFIFLSPHFPENYYLFCRALKKAGFNTLAIGEPSFGELKHELAQSVDWYYHVDDMHDYDSLREAVAFFINKFGPIRGIDSLNEYWLESEAALRTEFNIEGIKNDTICNIRRKSYMKKIYQSAGIKCARGKLVNSAEETKQFAATVGYPIIVKPDDGMGADLTYNLDNDAEADWFFNEKKPEDHDIIAEEYIQGDIVTFDGLTDKQGNIVFCTSHNYDQGVMESVLSDNHLYYFSQREIPADLERIGRIAVKAFNVKGRFFHMEFFRMKNGEICALEVNMRPPGGFSMDMFNYACDIDMYAAWAEVQAKGTVNLQYERKYHTCFISRKNRLNYRRTNEEAMRELGDMLVYYKELPPIIARGMGDQGYLVRAEKMEDIMKAVHIIQD